LSENCKLSLEVPLRNSNPRKQGKRRKGIRRRGRSSWIPNSISRMMSSALALRKRGRRGNDWRNCQRYRISQEI